MVVGKSGGVPRSPELSKVRRDQLHQELDELLDLRDEIACLVAQSGMSEELAIRLHGPSRNLVVSACRLASAIATGEARAITFRHPKPASNEALAQFLDVVAGYAAPHAYATMKLGIETFTWTDVVSVLNDLEALEHGDLPPRLRPAAKDRPRSTKFHVLREQWRAVLWVEYLTNLPTHQSKEAAVREVATAYGVSDRTVYNWFEGTEPITSSRRREAETDQARKTARRCERPDFTLAAFPPANDETASDWLKYDADHYKAVVKSYT